METLTSRGGACLDKHVKALVSQINSKYNKLIYVFKIDQFLYSDAQAYDLKIVVY